MKNSLIFDNSNGQPISYIFNNDMEYGIYVVADITPDESKMNLYGLLYKIGEEDDYILLKKINGYVKDVYFYQDWKNNLNIELTFKTYIGQLL